MPWWLVLAGLLVAAVAGWLLTDWLLAEADAGTTRAQLRIDAIRTGLTVVAGAGGAVALVLAARRQWLSERAQRHQERIAALERAHADRMQAHQETAAAAAHAHQDRLADITERDATERRVTELFARSVEHLGSDKAAVRLGGVYALERLGARHVDQRQAIVDVLCAYLRMPAGDGDGHVRLAAQRALTRHLRADDAGTYWPDMRIDLSGANLDRFDAGGCTLTHVDFRETVFDDKTLFDGATFESGAVFRRCRFLGAVSFSRAVWRCPARFREVTFSDSATFDLATFGDAVSFVDSTRCSGPASFRGVAFGSGAAFDRTEFGAPCSFSEATFSAPRRSST